MNEKNEQKFYMNLQIKNEWMNGCLMSCAEIHDPFDMGFGAW